MDPNEETPLAAPSSGYGDSEAEVARLCCDLWGDAAKKYDNSNVFHEEDPCHPRYD